MLDWAHKLLYVGRTCVFGLAPPGARCRRQGRGTTSARSNLSPLLEKP